MKTGANEQGSGHRGSWVVVLSVAWAAGCASPKAPFTDADWVSHSTTGRGCYERGDFRRGADAYARAEQRAQALDDADALAVAAVNRAVCLLAEGQAAAALASVQEALADARVSVPRQAELQVTGARALVALDKLEEAVAQARAALNGKPEALVRAQALLALGAVELSQKNSAAAVKVLSEGMSPKEWSRLPASIRAERVAQLGAGAGLENRWKDARVLQDEAAVLWKKAGRLPEMARALAEAGRMAQGADDLPGACDRYYRAARSLWAQGLQPEASLQLEEGLSCTELIADEGLARKMTARFVTLRNGKRLEQ